MEEEEEEERPTQKRKLEQISTDGPPNKILFVQNLPQECSELMLIPLFQKYGGFREVFIFPFFFC